MDMDFVDMKARAHVTLAGVVLHVNKVCSHDTRDTFQENVHIEIAGEMEFVTTPPLNVSVLTAGQAMNVAGVKIQIYATKVRK